MSPPPPINHTHTLGEKVQKKGKKERERFSIVEFPTSIGYNLADLVDFLLRALPIVVFDGVTDAGEILGAVPVPSVGCKEDVFVLFATAELFVFRLLGR